MNQVTHHRGGISPSAEGLNRTGRRRKVTLLSAWGHLYFLPSLATVLGVSASEVGWDVHLRSPGPRPLGLDRN